MDTDLWFLETHGSSSFLAHPIMEVLLSVHTGIQRMEIADSQDHGRALILDGTWQLSELDEAVYHETLIHPAAIMHGDPARVLILGGGDGASLREVLRWRGVESVTLVELDGGVVEACRAFFPRMLDGAFDDRRAHVVIEDAHAFMHRVSDKWDLIIADLTDPEPGGPAERLYTQPFYDLVYAALRPGGIFATHAGQVGLHEPAGQWFANIAKQLSTSFGHVLPLCAPVPTYGCTLGFLIASGRPLRVPSDAASIDRLLQARVRSTLRTLDGMAVIGLLHPPLYLRQGLEPG